MLNSIIIVFVLFTCLIIPIATAGIYILSEKRSKRRSPITEPLLPLPGETLSKSLQHQNIKLIMIMQAAILIPSIVTIILLYQWVIPSQIKFHVLDIVLAVIFISSIAWSVYATKSIMEKRRAIIAGLQGERATAQCFQPLLQEGWQIFHDLQCPRGNIDHVLVGPTGVFAIETKYRSKYAHIKGRQNALAQYDGQIILFSGKNREEIALQQARAVSMELAKNLQGKLGHFVPVTPVVSLPGWYVEGRSLNTHQEVIVLNPKNHALLTKRAVTIKPMLYNRICAALTEMTLRGTQ
ncbi:nuclease-related domain-containing protein [Zymomonas mobilis]|uniref:NERD domain protein n=1 Tax=Zymomonas mobilis subsp. pomaceae (strain ATCC 29192 / DSM 22645 / JCM 10191 / CCUG 17912 / NBRC 13757 / NCIMB 11200 / NRRL B-4491 / Barker I) TaxID=579138 RepID=F8EUY6_ZYMMT|nr:nuclease-related domain-containing protein [Zymomonas mobilis]AEI37274.1 NERD domain protein [Zymomonas mobilis subsp. pomaceae ATCC 29192]MDX5948643.1 nuclease-related domain-containing protein [Zymomonas mobilis subsp. pomaceae]GEB88448.1 hypothetical protein ZMO02_00850 [Zymomonas mobilis subsp. pomaceae]